MEDNNLHDKYMDNNILCSTSCYFCLLIPDFPLKLWCELFFFHRRTLRIFGQGVHERSRLCASTTCNEVPAPHFSLFLSLLCKLCVGFAQFRTWFEYVIYCFWICQNWTWGFAGTACHWWMPEACGNCNGINGLGFSILGDFYKWTRGQSYS